jgi:hypothetical protein
MYWRVDRRSLTQRTKRYFGFRPSPSDAPPRTPSVTRLVVAFLVVVALGVGMVVFGYPNAILIIGFGALLAIVVAFKRRWRPEPPEDPRGWRLDPNGKWRWWDGSAWTDGPAPGENVQQAGRSYPPEIEW